MSRYLIAALVVASSAFVNAQTKWRHELIVNHLRGVVNILPPGAFVNKSGIPAFTAWGSSKAYSDAFRGNTNLNVTYLGPMSGGAVGGINDSGQVLYGAETPDSGHQMVDGHDYFRDIFPAFHPFAYNGWGIDNAGLPLWYVTPTKGQPSRVFHGDEELGVGLQIFNAGVYRVNRKGDCIWRGTWKQNGQSNQDLFVGNRNISQAALASDRGISTASIDDLGNVLWSGTDSTMNGGWDLFLNGTNLTHGVLTGRYAAQAVSLTNSGHMLWYDFQDGVLASIMLDSRDISTPLFAGRPHSIYSLNTYVNDAGDTAWLGRTDDDLQYHVVVNGTDLSAPVLGSIDFNSDSVGVLGMDRSGNTLWYGAGAKTNHRDETFVNSFNLSRDALGDTPYLAADALAVGQNGQVLWSVTWAAGDNGIYLSTPVPEPSVLVPGLAVTAYVLRRRRKTSSMP